MKPTPAEKQSSWVDTSGPCATLAAIYADASTSIPSKHQFSYPILTPVPAKDSTSISDKTIYLSELRSSAKTLQQEINIFLTQKMEDEKLRPVTNEDGAQVKRTGQTTMDEAEEENYGEEAVGDIEDD